MRLLLPVLVTAAVLTVSSVPAAAVPGPPPLHQGWIVSQQNPSRCLTGGGVGTTLFTSVCDRANKAQEFYQTSEGLFTQGENCVQPRTTSAGVKAKVAACSFQADQNWWFTTVLQAGDQDGPCVTELKVDAAGRGRVRLQDCTGALDQQWRSQAHW
ncbi:MAG TPA: RICIN domain-containing protein [Actinoplanes sp.]|nr:RICIN domain-containing protein [Actinoplanes sp.]